MVNNVIKVSVTLLAFALALLAFGVYRAVTAAQSQGSPVCVFAQEKDRLVILAHEAIDEAYKKKVMDLFEIWVRDPVDQPRRATSGMQIAISAYHRARTNVRVWDPLLCEPPQ